LCLTRIVWKQVENGFKDWADGLRKHLAELNAQ
jgi:hypothetical protein